jgi:beta-glucanase (GH16 family)
MVMHFCRCSPNHVARSLVSCGLIVMLFGVSQGCKKENGVSPDSTSGDSTAIAGWSLVWHDEFNGTRIDSSIWTFEVNGNGGGNNELQYYTAEPRNAFLESGTLVIQALKESYLGKQYTSARMNTRGKRDWLYGRVDVRAKTPTGRGLWPAIWMLPTDWVYGGWPASGEIDIMELLGQEPGKVYGTIHFGSDPSHHLSSGGSYVLPGGASFAKAFHLFTLEWSADSLMWRVDNIRYHAEGNGAPFDKRFHLLLNVAVGGNWPGSPDGTTVFPQVMQVDYVRVYAKAK